MTLVQVLTLHAVIDEALDTLKGARCREIVTWIREQHSEVVAVHRDQLADEGLTIRVRERRKQRSPLEESKTSRNLCLDFGLSKLDLDSEISIPRDLKDLIFGGSNWKEVDDATLADIDAHILLLEAQAVANLEKADNWRRIRQAAARFADGNHAMTLGELRRIAQAEQAEQGRNP